MKYSSDIDILCWSWLLLFAASMDTTFTAKSFNEKVKKKLIKKLKRCCLDLHQSEGSTSTMEHRDVSDADTKAFPSASNISYFSWHALNSTVLKPCVSGNKQQSDFGVKDYGNLSAHCKDRVSSKRNKAQWRWYTCLLRRFQISLLVKFFPLTRFQLTTHAH